jgi:glycopeptide antibiotics resistance protein
MIPKFLFPFLVYRSIAFPFLVLSAITVPCWLAFRLYRLQSPADRVWFRREIVLLTFVVYLSGLAAATLLPNHPSRLTAETPGGIDLHPNLASLTCPSAMLARGSDARFFCRYNATGNILLFFPLGILLPLVWRRLRFWGGIQIAIALSSGIELIQYFSRTWINRTADVNDVILNALGAFLGLAVVFLLRFHRSAGLEPNRSPA